MNYIKILNSTSYNNESRYIKIYLCKTEGENKSNKQDNNEIKNNYNTVIINK